MNMFPKNMGYDLFFMSQTSGGVVYSMSQFEEKKIEHDGISILGDLFLDLKK